jgi:hypothetical protein
MIAMRAGSSRNIRAGNARELEATAAELLAELGQAYNPEKVNSPVQT